MSHSEALMSMSTASAPVLTSNARQRRTSLIAPTSAPAEPEVPDARNPYSKAHMHRRAPSPHTHHIPTSPTSVSAPATRPRLRPRDMLTKINTSLTVRTSHPDRPARKPYGPRSAYSPLPSCGSARSANKSHFADVWKARAGPSTIRTSPPQTSLPHDADAEQDPLFNVSYDHVVSSHTPRRYRLKLVDVDPFSSDEDSPFDSLFSFTASPVESPSYAATAFHPRQTASSRPAPLHTLHPPHNHKSFFSPMSPEFSRTSFAPGGGDRVDRWLLGSGGLEPLATPLIVDRSSSAHDMWDDGSQSDWREVIDRFLQYEGELEEPVFPPTPVDGARW